MTDPIGTCDWYQDADVEDSDSWETTCGKMYLLIDGTPQDNEMKFCCFCGRVLTSIEPESE